MSDNSSSPTWPSGPEFAAPSWEQTQWQAPGTLPPPPPSSTSPTGAPAAPSPSIPTHRSWQPGIMPLRPLSFGDFLSLPFKAVQFNRSVVLGGPLVFILLSVVTSVAALWLFFNEQGFDVIEPGSSLESISAVTWTVGVAAVVISILGDTMSTAMVAPGVAKAVLGERLTFGRAWHTVMKRFWHIVALYLLMVLMIGAVFGVYVVLVTVLMNSALALGAIVAIVAGIGSFILAGIIALYTVIARPIVILEKVSAFGALKRAWRLMKGRFWWTVLIVLVSSIMISVVASVIQTALNFVALMGVLMAPDNSAVGLLIFAIVTSIAITISYVMMSAYLGSIYTLIYTDLRIRHEGFHLDLARAAEANAATAT